MSQLINLNPSKFMQDNRTEKVVAHMLQHDAFSRWLGISVLELREGYSKIKMTLRDEMLNGLGVIHGGIAFSFADSAFAFACNNRNNLSLALDTAINFTKATLPGDVLTAEATEVHNGRSTGLYHVVVTNQHGAVVAHFKGTCFRTGKQLIP
jgi:acyl-CoA thioesterase